MPDTVTARSTTPLVLLAVGLAAVVAWQLRDWSSCSDVAPPEPPAGPIGAGHHLGAGGTRTPPPAIAASAVPNFAGITLLAAHVTTAGVLLAVAAARRWAAGRIAAVLVFAATVAVFTASATIPLASLTIGTGISRGNTLSAAVTVLRYSFVLSLLVAAAAHRLAFRVLEGDRRADQKRRAQTRFRRGRGGALPGEPAGVRAL
ncbi:hypothetical protein [Amycolatopsis sp. Hca4]|uniref:hypothetical protein n=1 Tax=Amycolatopsis sp. Hca4 TaxID=2742131 RepID=UPI0015903967|nr:hypothetical protein [Amycolatopsis sp. Hca4]QKV74049.1 hypothetical protein HUT10_09895 [Amycolatopsis sp. Hca4]